MDGKQLADSLRRDRRFLQNILQGFQPGDAGFRPTPEMMTVAQQVRHIGWVTDWFRTGMAEGRFDMDFEAMAEREKAECDLAEALRILDDAVARFAAFAEAMAADELTAPMPPNEILGPAPRLACYFANSDHMAHHRGALAVYLRLLGITPAMVYEG